MASKSFVEFLDWHYSDPKGQRLGQRFYNEYLRGTGSWPELFYGQDSETRHIIQKWLNDHKYYDTLPERVLE